MNSSRPLRICHLGKFYPPTPGGIETHTRTLAQAQARLGCRVSVLCMNDGPGATVCDRDGEIPVTRVGRRASIAKLDFCPDLLRRLSTISADVLHLQVPNPTMLLGLFRARPRIPLVVTYQSDAVRQRIRSWCFRPIERAVYHHVRMILPTSPTYVEGSRFLQRYTERLRVLPMGINLNSYRHPSAEVEAQATRIRERFPGPLWLACGRLIYYKGLETAISALPQTPGTLLIVGDGPERSRLETLAARLKVGDRIKFLGAMPYQHVQPYYRAATAFWFPSNARSEAFGIVQLEAMASGCPVINTAIPGSGVAWVSLHEHSGLTVPMNDPAALSRAARRLLDDPTLRDRLSRQAVARAQSEFSDDVMAARSLEAYEAVLKAARRRPEPTAAMHLDGMPSTPPELGAHK